MAHNIKISSDAANKFNHFEADYEKYHLKNNQFNRKKSIFDESESEYDEDQFANVDEDVIPFGSDAQNEKLGSENHKILSNSKPAQKLRYQRSSQNDNPPQKVPEKPVKTYTGVNINLTENENVRQLNLITDLL